MHKILLTNFRGLFMKIFERSFNASCPKAEPKANLLSTASDLIAQGHKYCLSSLYVVNFLFTCTR